MRRRVSELVEIRQGVDARQALIPAEQMTLDTLQSRKSKNTTYLTITIVVGVILSVLLVGIVGLFLALYYYRQRRQINRQIAQQNTRMATLHTEINTLIYAFNQKIDQVCKEIQDELSAAYIMKPRGTDLQMQTFQPNPVQTINAPPPIQIAGGAEIIRQSDNDLMIVCAFCQKPFPNTSAKCPYCGASRTASNLRS